MQTPYRISSMVILLEIPPQRQKGAVRRPWKDLDVNEVLTYVINEMLKMNNGGV
jgi:hypothetical protein